MVRMRQALDPAIDWQSSGWPQWSEYQPIVEAALGQRMPIVAASPSKAVTRKIGREGLSSISVDQQQRTSTRSIFVWTNWMKRSQ